MRKLLRRPRGWLYLSIIVLIINSILIYFVPPGKIIVDLLFLSMIFVIVFGLSRWINVDKIWQICIPIWIVSLLITNRLGALDLFTLGVSVGLLGLIILARGRV